MSLEVQSFPLSRTVLVFVFSCISVAISLTSSSSLCSVWTVFCFVFVFVFFFFIWQKQIMCWSPNLDSGTLASDWSRILRRDWLITSRDSWVERCRAWSSAPGWRPRTWDPPRRQRKRDQYFRHDSGSSSTGTSTLLKHTQRFMYCISKSVQRPSPFCFEKFHSEVRLGVWPQRPCLLFQTWVGVEVGKFLLQRTNKMFHPGAIPGADFLKLYQGVQRGFFSVWSSPFVNNTQWSLRKSSPGRSPWNWDKVPFCTLNGFPGRTASSYHLVRSIRSKGGWCLLHCWWGRGGSVHDNDIKQDGRVTQQGPSAFSRLGTRDSLSGSLCVACSLSQSWKEEILSPYGTGTVSSFF